MDMGDVNTHAALRHIVRAHTAAKKFAVSVSIPTVPKVVGSHYSNHRESAPFSMCDQIVKQILEEL